MPQLAEQMVLVTAEWNRSKHQSLVLQFEDQKDTSLIQLHLRTCSIGRKISILRESIFIGLDTFRLIREKMKRSLGGVEIIDDIRWVRCKIMRGNLKITSNLRHDYDGVIYDAYMRLDW